LRRGLVPETTTFELSAFLLRYDANYKKCLIDYLIITPVIVGGLPAYTNRPLRKLIDERENADKLESADTRKESNASPSITGPTKANTKNISPSASPPQESTILWARLRLDWDRDVESFNA
jgi:hypothetical protein